MLLCGLNTLIQSLELQVAKLRSPLARPRQRDSPATIFHLLKQSIRLVLRVFQICGADDEGGEVEHYEGEFRVDVVLDVVLPRIGG